MKNFIYCLSIMLFGTFLSSCSVVMAAKSGGVNVTTLSQCNTRACLISKGAQPISKKTNRQGNLVSETYKAYSPTGSAARAAMHGVLDVATLGIWEVAGTPIEAVKDKKKYYVIKVRYKTDGNAIKSIQLLR